MLIKVRAMRSAGGMRTGHQILANMMQSIADRNIPPSQVKPEVLEKAVESYTGKKITVSPETLKRLFDAMHCVRERKYRAGAAPERVVDHIAAARSNVERDRKETIARMQRVEAAHHRLDSAFASLQRKFA